MKYLVNSKYTDPDTGATSTKKVCECDDRPNAKLIVAALAMEDPEPNREYFIEEHGKKEDLILCIDTDQLTIAWQCHKWLNQHGVRSIICFSMFDFQEVKQIYSNYGIPHMVALVAKNLDQWKDLDYELKMSEFEEEDFETILSVME